MIIKNTNKYFLFFKLIDNIKNNLINDFKNSKLIISYYFL